MCWDISKQGTEAMTALPDGVSRIFLSEAPDHPAPDPAALQQELSGTDGLPAGQNAGGRGPVPGQEPPSRKGRGIRKITALESGKTDIFENLAIEEKLTEQAERDTLCLFFWRNADCVVIGRHQDPEAECHMETVRRLGIPVARRRTGGGAVFQDLGNLNVSFIAPADLLEETMCAQILVRALAACGVQARRTGRNDLVLDLPSDTLSGKETGGEADGDGAPGGGINRENKPEDGRCRQKKKGDGGKFSGSASRQTPEDIFLFHATLMCDVDLERMETVLNPPPQKLARHRIASVRSRVANLCDYYPELTMDRVKEEILHAAIAEFQAGGRER